MKHLLAAALLACGLAATAVPAQAAPLCGSLVGVNCVSGGRYCRIFIGPTGTCTHTA